MAITFDLSDVDSVVAALEAAPEQATKAAGDAGMRVGHRVKSRAQAEAPRDRPWLATRGIRVRTWRSRDSSHTDVFTVEDDEGRNVGFFVEHGTSTMPPRPFLTSQMAWAADEFRDAVLQHVEVLGS